MDGLLRRWDVILRSDFDPGTCLARLSEQIDIDRRTIFSFSGFTGKRPVLGRIVGREFRLHKRRYWHNSFGPVFYGRVSADGSGTRVEGYWSMWKIVRIFMGIWLVFVALIGSLVLISFVRQIIADHTLIPEDMWLGLLVPPGMFLFGLLLPRLGAALSFHERKHIVELLEHAVVGGQTAIRTDERNWRSSLW